jgi:hypothetical protein
VCVCVCVPRPLRTSAASITSANSRSKAALLFVLHTPFALDAFVEFSKSQHNEENVLFWIAVRDFKTLPADRLNDAAKEIFRKVCWNQP